MMVLVVGTTETAAIDGISAAGADPEAMRYTPAADAELLAYGDVVETPAVPVSPSGCPTPALVARAVREVVGFDLITLDSGLVAETGAPTVSIGDAAGNDIRELTAVPDAGTLWDRAEQYGRQLPVDRLVLAESIPGGTTTALAVSEALGVDLSVSSSLPDNPLERKREVVADALAASGVGAGDLAGEPRRTLQTVGDPVLAALAGTAAGALTAGTDVVLAGGTQQLAVTALLRHADITAPLEVATTPFVADDPTATVRETARLLDVDLTVTNPGFGTENHVVFERYRAGEAKEGAGMGGALAIADREDVSMATIRDRIRRLYENL
ncbi:MAG: TIGR00303 family protein [Halapricum sp.]